MQKGAFGRLHCYGATRWDRCRACGRLRAEGRSLILCPCPELRSRLHARAGRLVRDRNRRIIVLQPGSVLWPATASVASPTHFWPCSLGKFLVSNRVTRVNLILVRVTPLR